MPILVLYSNEIDPAYLECPLLMREGAGTKQINFVGHPVLVPPNHNILSTSALEYYRYTFSWSRMSVVSSNIKETHALLIGYWLILHQYLNLRVIRGKLPIGYSVNKQDQ